MKVLAIIPARYASTRFPGKPLAMIGEMSMIERVCRQVHQSEIVNHLIVATDDERILNHVTKMGFSAEMTSTTHQSGTDRCAEVAKRHPDYDVIINVQGDEPFIAPNQLSLVVQPLLTQSALISTLATPIQNAESVHSPHVVKVVRDSQYHALYFSRAPIPFFRDHAPEIWHEQHTYLQHLGLYAFRRATLLAITELPVGQLEQVEKLEQLRWLEAGYSIAVELTEERSFGIDTPGDLVKAEAWMATQFKDF
ncbi:MAG: 3-deoxy-manno-octulosonate cytidylyltransferase [Bacteroidota bacterium]